MDDYDVLLKKDAPSFETTNDIINWIVKKYNIKVEKEETDIEIKYKFL